MASADPSVSLVFTSVSLLSGGLDDCYDVDDDSCEGGIALIRAYMREYSDGIDEGNLVINRLDYQSVFVQMHPLNWNVNNLVLSRYFGMETTFILPSLLEQHKADSAISARDLSGLQSRDFRPLLVSNVVTGSTNSWSEYVKSIHIDETTGLAIIAVQGQSISTGEIYSLPPADVASNLIDYVKQENQARGCLESSSTFETYISRHNRTGFSGDISIQGKCLTPILIKRGGGSFQPLLDEILQFENLPAAVFNVESTEDLYNQPMQVGPRKLWVFSYSEDGDILRQIRLFRSQNRLQVTNITVLEHSMEGPFPNSTKDEQLRQDIKLLRELADEARENNPIQGLSMQMPIARIGNLRYCFGGECPIGNLFTDALRWYTNADFAFIQSGGVRGLGWPSGPIRISDIWASLPFANSECTGVVSGVTIFRLFELSTREAVFRANREENGDRLFQVSGLRYTYNTQIEAPRLVRLEILDKETDQFVPVERLKLYKFATSSWMCSGFHPFPSLLSEDELIIEGEQPKKIGDRIMQNIVADFLQYAHSTEPYDTSIQGRLVNDTSITEPLNFIQVEKQCTSTTYWVEKLQSCLDCPSTEEVILSGNEAIFEGTSGRDETSSGSAVIFNGENFPVDVALKSLPVWVDIVGGSLLRATNDEPRLVTIAPKQSLSFDYTMSSIDLAPGIATGALSFAVLDGGSFAGCVGRDLIFEVSLIVKNQPELFQEGSIRIAGFTMVALTGAFALAFALWVYTRSDNKAVKMMQPVFLLAICFGVFVMGLSILPRSLHGVTGVSERGEDMLCMATAWLLSMGFCLVMSALLAKLWRINTVVDGAMAFRRTNVSAKSAALNFSVQFVLNFVLMLIWTLVDPMQYEIGFIEGEDWKQYGTCTNMGAAGWTFMGLTVGINFCILLLAVYEAFKARKLGEQYSESAGVGLAIFSWLQLLMVGVPVLFLIDDDNVNPLYFLSVSLIFACCMSMLLFIFVPLIMKVRSEYRPTVRRDGSRFRFGVIFGSMSFRNSAPTIVPETTILSTHDSQVRNTHGHLSTTMAGVASSGDTETAAGGSGSFSSNK